MWSPCRPQHSFRGPAGRSRIEFVMCGQLREIEDWRIPVDPNPMCKTGNPLGLLSPWKFGKAHAVRWYVSPVLTKVKESSLVTIRTRSQPVDSGVGDCRPKRGALKLEGSSGRSELNLKWGKNRYPVASLSHRHAHPE